LINRLSLTMSLGMLTSTQNELFLCGKFNKICQLENLQIFSGFDLKRRQKRRKIFEVFSRFEADDAGVRKVGQPLDVVECRVADEDVGDVIVVDADDVLDVGTGEYFFEDAAQRE